MKQNISRREFLTTSAAAAAFTIVPRHVLGGPGTVAPSAKTTLACIGVGGQGQQNMTAFLQFPEVQVVAVCDVNRESGGYLSWNWAQGKERRTCGASRRGARWTSITRSSSRRANTAAAKLTPITASCWRRRTWTR